MNSIVAFLSIILIGVSCWEAETALHTVSSGAGYLFATFSVATNMLVALTLLLIHDIKSKYVVSLLVAISLWSIVLLTGILNESLHGPFHTILLVQSVIAMVGFFLGCSACFALALLGTTYLQYEPDDLV
jgi:hypothetical protein